MGKTNGERPRERVSIGPRLRFEVFRRDSFTCRYCGRKTPQVILEVDHVIPVAEGGGDELENLVTSCWECNNGKGAGLLDTLTPEADVHDKTVLLAEREMQLREYNAVRGEIRKREDSEIDLVLQAWEDMWPGKTEPEYYLEPSRIRSLLNEISVYDLLDSVEIAARNVRPSYARVKYFFGVAYSKARGPKEERAPEESPPSKKKSASKKKAAEDRGLIALGDLGFAIGYGGTLGDHRPGDLLVRIQDALGNIFRGDKAATDTWPQEAWNHFTSGLISGARQYVEWWEGDKGWCWTPEQDIAHDLGEAIGALGSDAAGQAVYHLCEPEYFDRATNRTTWIGPRWDEHVAGSFALGLSMGLEQWRKRMLR